MVPLLILPRNGSPTKTLLAIVVLPFLDGIQVVGEGSPVAGELLLPLPLVQLLVQDAVLQLLHLYITAPSPVQSHTTYRTQYSSFTCTVTYHLQNPVQILHLHSHIPLTEPSTAPSPAQSYTTYRTQYSSLTCAFI